MLARDEYRVREPRYIPLRYRAQVIIRLARDKDYTGRLTEPGEHLELDAAEAMLLVDALACYKERWRWGVNMPALVCKLARIEELLLGRG